MMTPTDSTSAQQLRLRRQRRIGAVIGAVALVASTSIGTAWAVTTFSDVPETHPFYDEIEEVAAAGIVNGYADGTYRPAASVTRQALAAMLSRGLSRSTGAEAQVNLTSVTTEADVTKVTVFPQGSVGSTGHITLTGTATAIVTNETLCPCHVRIWIEKGTERISPVADETVGNVPEENGAVHASLATNAYVEVTASQFYPIIGNDYTLVAEMVDGDQTLMTIKGSLTAVYTPFAA